MKTKRMARVIAVACICFLVLGLCSCSGEGQRSVQLSDGWQIRSDAQAVGEAENWHKGFEGSDLEENIDGDILWYCRVFRSKLTDGKRMILTLCDMDEGTKVWLNGKRLDYTGAWGVTRLDVSGIAKKSGKNTLVIRTEKGKAWSLARTTLSAAGDAAILGVDVHTKSDGTLDVQAQVLGGNLPVQMTVTAADTGKVMTRVTEQAQDGKVTLSAKVDGVIHWTAANPFLYTLEISADGERYLTDIGFTDRQYPTQDSFVEGGVPVLIKAVTVPESVLLHEDQLRTFVNFIRTVGFNTVKAETGKPTQALLEYCSATGIYVGHTGQTTHPAAWAEIDGAPLAVFGDELTMPEQVSAESLQAWYKEYGLDRQFGTATQAYEAIGKRHVQAVEAQLRRLRTTAQAGFVYTGSILPYPNTMLDVLSDSIQDLRFCIDVPESVSVGAVLPFTVALSDHYVLWDREFTATVSVTGPSGVLYEKKVTVTGQEGNQVLPLVSDSVRLPSAEGTYKVSVVMDNYAHPTCGEATVRAYRYSDLPSAVYADGLSESAQGILRSLNVRMLTAMDAAGQDDTVVVEAWSESAKAAAARGAKVVVLSAEDLPVDGKAAEVTYAFIDGRAVSVKGMALGGATATTVVPAIGFDGNDAVGGALVSACDYESGRLVVCTVIDLEWIAAALLAE